MRHSVRAVLTALIVAAPAAAAAADVDLPKPENASADWSGPWIGAFAGVGSLLDEDAFAGVAAGYDLQFDRVVVGVEGEIAGGGIDARRAGGRYDVEALGAIRARVGYAFDRFVAYGTAGLAFASAEFARAGAKDRATTFGWTVGAGLEVALGHGVSARLEYLYVDLDRAEFDAGGETSLGASGGLARVGLNYRF